MEVTIEELLDDYFYARRDAEDFFNDCSHPMTNGAGEFYNILYEKYKEIETKIIERTIDNEALGN